MAHPYWPLFDLVVRTPRLTLRYADDDLATRICALAAQGVHDPEDMPFDMPWTRRPPGELERESMKYYWSLRVGTSPGDWSLLFAVHDADVLAGVQELAAKDFSVARSCTTGSWLGRAHQGRGIGTAMRAAVLELAFTHLGAQQAHTACWADNAPSESVTRRLGYEANGWEVRDREGKAERRLAFVMTRERWFAVRREPVEVDGLEPCRLLLGLA